MLFLFKTINFALFGVKSFVDVHDAICVSINDDDTKKCKNMSTASVSYQISLEARLIATWRQICFHLNIL